MEMETRTSASLFELLQHEHYTADEVARLLGISVAIVRHAAFWGELPAQIVGHHIIRLRQEDVVAWWNARDLADHARP
jgi:excisionase family DNA binding protein